MNIAKTIKEVRDIIKKEKSKGKTIGFVPTMGYLHEGHLSLVRRAKEETDFVVVSIFVNPLQFGPKEDFKEYPRDLERDIKLLEEVKADLLFAPEVEEMYPPGYKTYVEVTEITDVLCGASRPGHFKGVTTVVAKLFNIVKPDKAFFGQKDAQQVAVIKKMVKDLNMDLEIVPVPTVREEDGLAMSSRNVYLNTEERKAAPILYKSLQRAKELIEKGEKNSTTILKEMEEMISKEPLAKIDYIEIVDGETLKRKDKVEGNILIALAVKIGRTRLIDNIQMEV